MILNKLGNSLFPFIFTVFDLLYYFFFASNDINSYTFFSTTFTRLLFYKFAGSNVNLFKILFSVFLEFSIRHYFLISYSLYAESYFYVESLIIDYSSYCLITCYLIFIQFSKKVPNGYKPSSKSLNNTAISICNTLFYPFAFLGVCLSIVSYQYNISFMGLNEVVLPYRLNGIIYHLKYTIIPLVCLLAITYTTSNEKKIAKSIFQIAIYLIFCVIETIITSSRGIILTNGGIICIICFLNGHKTMAKIIFCSAVLCTAFGFLVLTQLRNEVIFTNSSLNSGYSAVMNETTANLSIDRVKVGIYRMYTRIFRTVNDIDNIIYHIPSIEQTGKIKDVMEMGSVSKYNTILQVGLKESNNYSIGISMLAGGLLLGGRSGLFLELILLCFFVIIIDNIQKNNNSEHVANTVIKIFIFITILSGLATFINGMKIYFTYSFYIYVLYLINRQKPVRLFNDT